MPAGIKRSKWTPILSRSLGFSTLQRLRDILNEGGIKAPYEDDKLEAALKLLREKGHNTSKFEAAWAARDTPPVAASAAAQKAKAKGAKHAPAGSASRVRAAVTRKQRTGEKLLYRLAELLPVGPSNWGRTQARMILEAAGVYKKQKTDEAKALAAFEARGISTAKFRHSQAAAQTNGTTQVVVVSEATAPPMVTPPRERHLPKIFEMGLAQIEATIVKEIKEGSKKHISTGEAQALYLNSLARSGTVTS